MKKVILFLLVLSMISAVLPISASADSNAFNIDYIDVTPRPGKITLLTPAYNKHDTGMSGTNILEIVVSGDTITASGSVGNKIPSDGYVIVVRGGDLVRSVLNTDPKVGDRVMLSDDMSEFYILNENFDPFYSVTIKFDGYNRTRSADTIIIYDRGATTGTNIWGSEVVVDANGSVASIGGNDNAIPVGGYVISAVGSGRMAELNNAAALGLTVRVDKDTKTITFEYGKETVVNSMDVLLVDYRSRVNEAKSRYAVIDYEACERFAADLEEKIITAESLLKKDDIITAMIVKREFERILTDANNALIEYPAVEARTLWIRPTGSSSRKQVNATVEQIYEMGYNTVCVELLYECTTIFPIDSERYGFSQMPSLNGFDVLAAYIEECHKYGIEVQGWMSVFRVGYAQSIYSSLSVASKHPEWRQKSASGKDVVSNMYGDSWFLNPAIPEVTELLLDFYSYILENYDLDAFQLDYVRYPIADGEVFGYDDYTIELFKKEYNTDPRDLKSGDKLWQTWCEFRASFVTDFVKKLSTLINEKRPDIYLSASVAPNFKEVYSKYMQEAEKWLKEGIIDIALPMAYGTNVIPLYASYTVEAAGDNAYSYIGVSDYGVDVYMRQIEEIRASGAEGVAFFSYSQYLSGGYADPISTTYFSKSSLSPSYDAKAAMSAQLAYVLERVYSVCVVDENALSLSDIDLIFDNITPVLDGDIQTMRSAAEKILFDLEKSDCDAAVKSIIGADLNKAVKIASLSKDDEKAEYRKTHPLPERYDFSQTTDESGQDVSVESSDASVESSDASVEESADESSMTDGESGDESFSDGQKSSTAVIVVVAVCAVAVLIAALVLIRKRKQ